jgi:GGDEF domain-containing protein
VAAAERVRDAINGVRADGAGSLGASVGAVLVGWGRDATWSAAYEIADRALYEAKSAGKNQVCTADMIGVPDQP